MIDKEALIAVRFPLGLTKCEYCETPTPAAQLEAHHMLFHRDKRYPVLDAPENLCLVCHKCHTSGVVNSWRARQWFWDLQISRGYNLVAWVDNLPLRAWHPHFGVEKSPEAGG